MNNKVLIDASTLKTGGGLQVAESFITDIINQGKAKGYSLYLSNEFYNLCKNSNIELSEFKEFRIRSSKYIKSIFLNCIWYRGFSTVFCIFGPPYYIFKPKVLISGFARPSIIYPEYKDKYFKNNKLNFFKNFLQIYFLKKCQHIIVESNFVKEKLIDKLKNFNENNISVVGNCLSKAFINRKNSFQIPTNDTKKLLYVGSNYPHKNLSIVGSAISFLTRSTKNKFVFYVTMSNEDYAILSDELKKYTVNLGYVKSDQLQSLYKSIDVVVFPSLFECFSILPIETLYCKKPLVASNRMFVYEFCENIPFYFDPNNYISLAEAIQNALKIEQNSYRLIKGKKLAEKFSNSIIRTQKYLEIIKKN